MYRSKGYKYTPRDLKRGGYNYVLLLMNWVMLEVVYSLWLKKIKHKGLRGEWGWYTTMDCPSKDR